MAGAVVLGRVKVGQYVTFRDIVFRQDGSLVDLTDGAEVDAQLRLTPDAPTAIDFEIDNEQLAVSRIRLTLDSDTTAAMTPGTYYGDVRVTSDDKHIYSDTFEVVVEQSVTR